METTENRFQSFENSLRELKIETIELLRKVSPEDCKVFEIKFGLIEQSKE